MTAADVPSRPFRTSAPRAERLLVPGHLLVPAHPLVAGRLLVAGWLVAGCYANPCATSEACRAEAVALVEAGREPARAEALLERACALGSGASCMDLAVVAKNGGQPATRWLPLANAACRHGVDDGCGLLTPATAEAATLAAIEASCTPASPKSCLLVGSHLASAAGRGKAVVDAWSTACLHGVPEICGTLVAGLVQGSLPAVSPARVVELAEAGCAADQPDACVFLGVTYEEGVGHPADPGKAAALYAKACALRGEATCPQAARLGGALGGGE